MEREFARELPRSEKQSLLQRERLEMEQDISVFSLEQRKLVEKWYRSEILTEEEKSIFYKARSEWWENKYGFPYVNRVARYEVLRRKYTPQEELSVAQNLQKSLFEAVKQNNEEKVRKLKKIYEESYPDQLEGVEALFGLPSFLEGQDRLDYEEELRGDERRKILQELTEYQFLLTHFVSQNANDKKFLKIFWDVWEKIAEERKSLKKAHARRRSILSQVAVFKLLESLGRRPSLSHPKEDAFHAVDIWADSETAIQVKGAKKREVPVPEIVDVDEIAFPGVQSEAAGKPTEHFNTNIFLNDQYFNFKVKLKDYERVLGKDLKGYMVVVPYEKFDFVTGEPSKELIDQLREKLGEKRR